MQREKGPLPGIRLLAEAEAKVGKPEPKPLDPAAHRSDVLEVGYLGREDRKVKLNWTLVDQATTPLPKINVPQSTTPYGQ